MHEQDCHQERELSSARSPIHVAFADEWSCAPLETVCRLLVKGRVQCVGADALDQANCPNCCRILECAFGDRNGSVSDLLRRATEVGVRVFVSDRGHIRQVYGQWWLQDLIDAIWEREHDVAAALHVPSFSDAEKVALEAVRQRFRHLPQEDRLP